MSGPERVLVTGASGFLGQALVQGLFDSGYAVRASSRTPHDALEPMSTLGWHRADITTDPLDPLLHGIDAVVHAAGIAHAKAAEAQHQRVTVGGTRRLVEAMRRTGAARLVFISSIRAQVGAHSPRRIADGHALAPADAYGRAKRDAEEVVAASGLDATILRPVLVADVGARGNLAALLRLAQSPLPLPFAALTAKRSLVSRRAVADAVSFALGNSATSGRRFNVADPEPLDPAQIVTIFRRGLGVPLRLTAVPEPLLRGALRLLGRSHMFDRLARPLVVAADGLHGLGWTAPEWAAEALYRMARRARAGTG
jgi:UDP-glucose 4-epimerase